MAYSDPEKRREYYRNHSEEERRRAKEKYWRRKKHNESQLRSYYRQKRLASDRDKKSILPFLITMEELEIWLKYRKMYGDPEKYDWKRGIK